MSTLDVPFNDGPHCFGFRIGGGKKSISDEYLSEDDQKKKNEIDSMLSEAMNTLTFEERQAQQEVLHGVGNEIREEATFIEKSLSDLEEHLLRMKPGRAYETAEIMRSEYVGDRAFRTMFLRGNRYDAKATADQMIRFFEIKLQIFGKDRLVKDITLNDLDKDDLACLKTGSIQLAGKDQSNREIILTFPGLRAHKTIQNQMRANYYIMMNALESSETQMRGIVALSYSVGEFRDKHGGEGYQDLAKLVMAIPTHMAAYHVCVSGTDAREYVLYSVLVKAINISLRARFQAHFGTHQECQYSLSTFGIPTDNLPFIPGTQRINRTRHLAWFQSCILRDKVESSTSLKMAVNTMEPNENDVLFVSGKQCHNGGNDRLRKMVKDTAQLYTSATSAERRLVVDNTIAEIRKAGGRFLKQQPNRSQTEQQPPTWGDLTTEEARAKIYQMFRNNKRMRGASSRQNVPGTPIAGGPLTHDVLLGKFERNGGNVLLLNLVKDRFEEYDDLDRGRKAVVVNEVLVAIKATCGRFLQSSHNNNGSEFFEVSNEKAREAISKCFRNYRRRTLKKAVHTYHDMYCSSS
ncbi:MAG: hypothetical protein SGBAC_011909 [Bacillariaceae sp.]